MPVPTPEDHPLRRFFIGLTYRKFSVQLGWNDIPVSEYIANLLIEFIHVDNLFRIQNHRGEKLQDVGEMLLEADVLLNAGSIDREREVHQQIGDFTLFMVGVFPEYLQRIKTRQMIHHPDFLIDYVRVGKQSYRNVSELENATGKGSVPVFKKLAENFELCVVGLGYVKDELEKRKPLSLKKARLLQQN